MNKLVFLIIFFSLFIIDVFADGPVYNFNFNHGNSGVKTESTTAEKYTSTPNNSNPQKIKSEEPKIISQSEDSSHFRFRLAGFRVINDRFDEQKQNDGTSEVTLPAYSSFQLLDQASLEIMYKLLPGFHLAAGVAYTEFGWGRSFGQTRGSSDPLKENYLPKARVDHIYGFTVGGDFRPQLAENLALPLGIRYQRSSKSTLLKYEPNQYFPSMTGVQNVPIVDKIVINAVQLNTGISFQSNNLFYEALANYTISDMEVYGLKYNSKAFSLGLALGYKI